MRLFAVSLLLLQFSWSPAAMAGIDLQLADGIRLLAVDGKEIESGSLLGRDSRYRLDDGVHQLLVEFEAELVRGGDELELDTSDSFVLLFTAADTTLRLSVPKIGSLHEFRAFDRLGDWRLRDRSGADHPFKLDRLEKEGFQLGRDYERELQLYNGSGAVAAFRPTSAQVFAGIPLVAGASHPSAAEKVPSSDQALVRQMLIYWYNQADPDTRRQFRAWLAR